MDVLETMVNQRTAARRNAGRNSRVRRHLNRVISAVVIATAFLLFALAELVHPALATVVMAVSLMFGCYHLGRCVRFGMRGASK